MRAGAERTPEVSEATSSHGLIGPEDVADMLQLARTVQGHISALDLEENMALESVRENTRLWRAVDGDLVAFAYVDDWNNLWYECAAGVVAPGLQDELVQWGLACVARRSAQTGAQAALDALCPSADVARMELLERHGFARTGDTTLTYLRSLELPIEPALLPDGFHLRHVQDEEEAASLVELHRAAFGTDQMTVERRLAIMRVAQYDPALDLLAVARDGELAAGCLCTVDLTETQRTGRRCGSADIVYVRPKYRRLGLGRAMLTAALTEFQRRGMEWAELGTSGENRAMQGLAKSAGFHLMETKIWLTRVVANQVLPP